MYGYAGKYLVADLSTKTYEIFELSEDIARAFLGGPALGARLLWDLMPENTPCFDEKSVVGFVTGAFNNVPTFYGGRYTVVSKSPFNDGFNDANSGGFFGTAIKRSGFDAIFVKGISDTPVYLYVKNGQAEFKDASFLWGKTMTEADKAIKEDCKNQNLKYAMIGISGEMMSYEAAVMNDLHHAAARGGSAAIMGSKKLKAVVCEGNSETKVYDREALTEINKKISKIFVDKGGSNAEFSRFGTTSSTIKYLTSGDAHAANFAKSLEDGGLTVDDYAPFDGQHLRDEVVTEDYGCAGCPVRCGAVMDNKQGKWPLENVARPEYEASVFFGADCLNTDRDALFVCNDLCNQYGIDIIGCGGTAAWAIQAYNEGALSPELVDNIDLTYGNSEGMVELVRRICEGTGCGEVLRNGSKFAAEKWGCGFEQLVLAGNLELPAHDPRRQPGYVRTYFSDPTPARHVKGGISSSFYEKKRSDDERFDSGITGFYDALGIRDLECANSLGLCRFGFMKYMTIDLMLALVEPVTGFKFSKQDSYFFGLRSFTARHMFGFREGYSRDKFSISKILCGEPPLTTGPVANNPYVDAQKLTDNLYNTLGYKWNGMPLQDSLELMGDMEYVIDYLYPKEKK